MTEAASSSADVDKFLPSSPKEGSVALLGGSFDPPHLGHAMVALSVLALTDVEALWVLPSGSHPFGKAPAATFEQRMHMCRLAFSSIDGVEVLDLEQRLPAPTTTVQTLERILSARPRLQPRWVIGADLIEQLDRWHRPDKLRDLATLCVVGRKTSEITEEDRQRWRLETLDVELPNISSSAIRSAFAKNPPSALPVDRRVKEYARHQGIYG